MCVAGASVREICAKCDERVEEETAKVKLQFRKIDLCRSASISYPMFFQAFKKDKKVQKGIAFPCCVSVNNCICHFSPMNSDPDVTLKVSLRPHFKR